MRDFRQLYPQVTLSLHQGSQQVAKMLISGESDIGIATEALTPYDALVTPPVIAEHTASWCLWVTRCWTASH